MARQEIPDTCLDILCLRGIISQYIREPKTNTKRENVPHRILSSCFVSGERFEYIDRALRLGEGYISPFRQGVPPLCERLPHKR